MNLKYYVESILALLKTKGKNWATHSIDKVEDAEEYLSQFQHLFFDIDDTLNGDGLGLDKKVCDLLDKYSETHDVVLVTNCSSKRAQQHADNLNKFNCKAELWPVGKKPHYPWLKAEVENRGWSLDKSAMFGDRPTMDIWCAYKAGFAGRFWVKSWMQKSSPSGLTWYIKKWEWQQIKGT